MTKLNSSVLLSSRPAMQVDDPLASWPVVVTYGNMYEYELGARASTWRRQPLCTFDRLLL